MSGQLHSRGPKFWASRAAKEQLTIVEEVLEKTDGSPYRGLCEVCAQGEEKWRPSAKPQFIIKLFVSQRGGAPHTSHATCCRTSHPRLVSKISACDGAETPRTLAAWAAADGLSTRRQHRHRALCHRDALQLAGLAVVLLPLLDLRAEQREWVGG